MWLFNQILCLFAYIFIVFLSNTLVGIGLSALSIIIVLVIDVYLHCQEKKKLKTVETENDKRG